MKSPAYAFFLCGETLRSGRLYPSLENLFGRELPVRWMPLVWIVVDAQARRTEERDLGWTRAIVLPKPGFSMRGLQALAGHGRRVSQAIASHIARHGLPAAFLVRDDVVMAVVARRWATRLGIPWVYQVSHFKEEDVLRQASGRRDFGRWLAILGARLARARRNALLGQADLVLPISQHMAHGLSGLVQADRIHVVPEGVTGDPPSLERAAARRALGLPDDSLVLVYVGSIASGRDPGFLLDVAEGVRAAGIESTLLVVGGALDPRDEERFRAAISSRGLGPVVRHVPQVPPDQVPRFLAAADIGLSPIPPQSVFLASSPIKTLEYLQAGLPAIVSEVPDQAAVARSSGGAMVIPYEAKAWVEAVRVLAADPARRSAMGTAGRSHVLAHRSFKVLAAKLVVRLSGLQHRA